MWREPICGHGPNEHLGEWGTIVAVWIVSQDANEEVNCFPCPISVLGITNFVQRKQDVDKIRAHAERIAGSIWVGVGGEEFAVSRGEPGMPVMRENFVTVGPFSGLLANDVEERVSTAFEGKYGVEVRKDEVVA